MSDANVHLAKKLIKMNELGRVIKAKSGKTSCILLTLLHSEKTYKDAPDMPHALTMLVFLSKFPVRFQLPVSASNVSQ